VLLVVFAISCLIQRLVLTDALIDVFGGCCVARRLWELYSSQSGVTSQDDVHGGTLNEVNIRPVLNALDLFPTRSQGMSALFDF